MRVPDRTGLEWLRAAVEGREAAPPVASDLGIRLTGASEGRATVEYRPAERHLNAIATIHGGILAALADTAGSCAVVSAQPAGVVTPTLEMKINYLRPVTGDTGRLVATGTLLSQGRRTALAEARITDPEGRLVAHATVTCSIVRLDGAD